MDPADQERLIDYIRIHVIQAGGFTPCRKIAAMGELFGVRTAWHGPGDVSPIGHMANVTLDVACYNFGVQEYSPFNERCRKFSWLSRDEERLCVSERGAGLGYRSGREGRGQVSLRQENAATRKLNGGWGEVRTPDGTIIKQ